MTPIIIDTDPGQDDAMAILLAFAVPDRIDVRLISTVAGNVGVAQTTANALRVRDLAGRGNVPVHAGMAGPLVAKLETAEFVAGPDGLSGSGLPAPQSEANPTHAVLAIIDAISAAPAGSITICALGPLSNIAMAIRLAPDIIPRIGRIVLMGGAMGLGNMSPAAEYNFYCDPHAAAVVMASGIDITMFGLQLTLQAIASPAHMQRLRALGTRAGASVHGMLARPRAAGLGTVQHPMHDPCVIAFLLWPELFSGRHCHVGITTEGELAGRSTIDWNNRMKRAPNAYVPDQVDADTLFDRMIDAIATLA